jgi:hypothetical protein
MKKLWLAAVLALGMALSGPALAQRSGVYEVSGTNLEGQPYTGLMEIQQVGSASFRVLWSIGGELVEGVGMVSGRTFTTAFAAGDQTGMGIYEIQAGDVLDGEWTLVGAFNTGTETARRLPEEQQPREPLPEPEPQEPAPPAAEAPAAPPPAAPTLPLPAPPAPRN